MIIKKHIATIYPCFFDDEVDVESTLKGENKALKDEIEFLRNQIAMLLERK